MNKDKLNEFKELIKSYMLKGCSVNEVMSLMKDEIAMYFAGDVDRFYRLVNKTFENVRSEMSKEEYENIKVLRKERAESLKLEKYRNVADKVKLLTEENEKKCATLRDALSYAVQSVANYESLVTAVVRNYIKTIYPDFYDYYYFNRNVTEEYLVEMANKIIEKNMYRSVAVRMLHYNKMLDYITEKRPDLLEKIKEVYASHEVRPEGTGTKKEKTIFKEDSANFLIAIIAEFRAPLKSLCTFINANLADFCETINPLSEEEVFENLRILANNISSVRLKWYLSESGMPEFRNEPYNSLRITRFEEFMAKFSVLKHSDSGVNAFVLNEIKCDITSGVEKLKLHNKGDLYDLTLSECRELIKYLYKNAISLVDFSASLDVSRGWKESAIAILSQSEDAEDQMLVEGYNRLSEHHLDLYHAEHFGRK